MGRKPGYYWVKYEGEWIIGLYGIDQTMADNPPVEHWSLPAFINDSWWHSDEDFDEIDEERIVRRDVDAMNAKHDIKPPTDPELREMWRRTTKE